MKARKKQGKLQETPALMKTGLISNFFLFFYWLHVF